MTVSIVAKNASQGSQSLLRGARLINIGSSGSGEQDIDQGGLLNYNVPPFKTAIIKGTFVITNFGTNNTFMQVELFDSQSGRLVPIARGTVVGQTVAFELKLTQLRPRPEFSQDQNVAFHGDGAVSDGTAEWFVSIEERPN